jgi:hypothetical protein
VSPVIHRRTIFFNKQEGSWLIEDEFFGDGDHDYEVRFHFAPDLLIKRGDTSVTAVHNEIQLSVSLLDPNVTPVLENQASSIDYGDKTESITACWHFAGKPGKIRWKIQVVDGQ